MKVYLLIILLQVEYVLTAFNEPQWMPQQLDHFNPVNKIVWKQRYYVDDQYFKANGPVFLQLGNEGGNDPFLLFKQQPATTYSQKYNSMNIALEHRYYGESHPTKDLSTFNLRFLTTEQALADVSSFINAFKAKHPGVKNSKWVVFGRSYSGTLAAWMRYKFPHLVVGAVASSAPMKAVVNFKEYLGVVGDQLGSQCNSAISKATQQLSDAVKSPRKWAEVTRLFRLCDPLNGRNKNDVSNLMNLLANTNIGLTVQYNKDNIVEHSVLFLRKNITIDTICAVMADRSNGDEIEQYAQVNSLILNASGQNCLNYKYSRFIKAMKDVSWDKHTDGLRQWTYQTCVQFGYFQSSDLTDQPFGQDFPVEFFIKQCKDIFGREFDFDRIRKGVDHTNEIYGGFDIRLSNTVLPNGSVDPWHILGLLNYTNENSKSIFIEGTAHCADTDPDSPSDIQALIGAREQISNYIGNVLNSSTQQQ